MGSGEYVGELWGDLAASWGAQESVGEVAEGVGWLPEGIQASCEDLRASREVNGILRELLKDDLGVFRGSLGRIEACGAIGTY